MAPCAARGAAYLLGICRKCARCCAVNSRFFSRHVPSITFLQAQVALQRLLSSAESKKETWTDPATFNAQLLRGKLGEAHGGAGGIQHAGDSSAGAAAGWERTVRRQARVFDIDNSGYAANIEQPPSFWAADVATARGANTRLVFVCHAAAKSLKLRERISSRVV